MKNEIQETKQEAEINVINSDTSIQVDGYIQTFAVNFLSQINFFQKTNLNCQSFLLLASIILVVLLNQI